MALLPTIALDHVRDAVATVTPDNVAGGGEGRGIEVSVPCVTNRRLGTSDLEAKAYGGERGAPDFGGCAMVLTPIPVRDRIAPRARLLADLGGPRPRQRIGFVVLMDAEPMP